MNLKRMELLDKLVQLPMKNQNNGEMIPNRIKFSNEKIVKSYSPSRHLNSKAIQLVESSPLELFSTHLASAINKVKSVAG